MGQGSGFETDPVFPANMMNLVSLGSQDVDFLSRSLDCFVGRIVQDLNLESILWILHVYGRFDDPLDHMEFVVDRKLDSDERQVIFIV